MKLSKFDTYVISVYYEMLSIKSDRSIDIQEAIQVNIESAWIIPSVLFIKKYRQKQHILLDSTP